MGEDVAYMYCMFLPYFTMTCGMSLYVSFCYCLMACGHGRLIIEQFLAMGQNGPGHALLLNDRFVIWCSSKKQWPFQDP